MIDGRDDLPIKQQAKLLKLARSSVYYQPVPLPASDLKLMHRIDRLHLAHPFAGSRMLRESYDHLWCTGKMKKAVSPML
jgi:putative transposase